MLSDTTQREIYSARYFDRRESPRVGIYYEAKPCGDPVGKTGAMRYRREAARASGSMGLRAFPSPFSLRAQVLYRISAEDAGSLVDVSVFDVMGRNVTSLVHEIAVQGAHAVQFDGTDLPSGEYTVVVRTGSRVQRQSIVRVR